MNTPTTPEGAAETFRCEPYTCTLTGRACALTHVKAVQTKAHSREHCITCEAGAARAELLNVGPLKCGVPDGKGSKCSAEPEPGADLCHRHRHHRNLIPMPKGEKVDKFEAKPPPKQREVFRPTGEVRETKRVARDKPCPDAVRRPPQVKSGPARIPTPPCAGCGWPRKGIGPGRSEFSAFCGECLRRSRAGLKARGVVVTPEAVAEWLRTPVEARAPVSPGMPPCARCGVHRGHGRPGNPATAAWCRSCLDVARQTLYRAGVLHPTPEQVAERVVSIPVRRLAVDVLAEIRAAVARALAAGASVEDIRAELALAARPAVEAEAA